MKQADDKIVGFTALPAGWRNVFTRQDGSVEVSACPGVLHVIERSATAANHLKLPGGNFSGHLPACLYGKPWYDTA